MTDNKVNKNEINPSEIKANIYDTIELVIDINGVTNTDLQQIEGDLKKVLSASEYDLFETELYVDEINEIGKRKNIVMSPIHQKRLSEKESVLRFTSKDETEKVAISRMFVSIKLDYRSIHSLSEKIKLMNSIIECFGKIDYFCEERITINKVDSLVCSSLYRLYQCFDRKMFGDIAYGLNRIIEGHIINEQMLRNESYFEYDNNEISIRKEISSGILNSNKKNIVYQGLMDITASYDCLEHGKINVDEKIKELNYILFKIFLNHITESFVVDLINGETNKVLEGFNKNE